MSPKISVTASRTSCPLLASSAPLVEVDDLVLGNRLEVGAREWRKFINKELVDWRPRMASCVCICCEGDGHQLVEPGRNGVGNGRLAIGDEANAETV